MCSRLAHKLASRLMVNALKQKDISAVAKELRKARSLLRMNEALLKLDRYRAIVIDDQVYVKRDNAETGVLFELIAHRDERGCLPITSNHPFSNGMTSSWTKQRR